MKHKSFKKLVSSFLITSMVLLSFNSAFGAAATPVQLKDITDSYAQIEINSLVDKGIISGYEDGSFQPNNTITRAELAKIIVLSLGLKENSDQAIAFTDVDKNSWYRGFAGALVESKITQGTSATTFAPDSKVTREELAVFFIRALGLEDIAGKVAIDANLSDLSTVSSWAQAQVSLAFKIGLIQGIGNPDATVKFSPKENSERQAVARLAYEFNNNKDTFVKKANELVNSNLKVSMVTIVNNNSIEVTFSSDVATVNAVDFTFDHGLIVTKAELKPGSTNVVVLTTNEQAPGAVYKLSYLGKETGNMITSASVDSSGSSSNGNSIGNGSSSNGSSNGNGSNNSGGNTPVLSVLAAPTNLVANAGNSQINLSWSSVTGATYYNVYQSLDNSNFDLISKPETVTSATYVVTALTNGVPYYFKISAANTIANSTYSNIVGATPLVVSSPVNLGAAGNYVILAEAGISSEPNSTVTGDIGVSPIAATAITGFSLTLDATGVFSVSNQINGKAYASDYASSTQSNLSTAINNMKTAYTDAAGRAVNYTELYDGNISGKTLTAGVYKWGTGVLINSDVTLNGGANDVWIFQIAKGITQANNTKIILTGGAQAKNIFWQVAETVSIGTDAHFEGIILGKSNITLKTNASINGRLLAQTAVTLDKSTVVAP
ncbi:hypothetical protein J2T13_004723 [Paenibacillus sp. DS2015]|uniref:ice-binding family protein n=1 Tax=Paenibacillus sp. DS2015 TaxID=3373917 RepID=UPI003D24676B